DMLERLADMLRTEDSRGGFEAKADMLSITGMTLEQFADLMNGLGYSAVQGEREKLKAPVAKEAATEKSEDAVQTDAGDAKPVEEPADGSEATADDSVSADKIGAADIAKAEPEVEVFYTFKWGGNRANRTLDGKREANTRGKGKPGSKKGGPRRDQGNGQGRNKGAQKYQSRPPKPEKQIDPDNPFAAALMGLRDKT
ncbi:MAG: disulfide oxidoreductase, partial [Paracoccaceae bacterium]